MIQRWNIQGSEVTPDDEGNYVLYAHHRKKLEADRDWMRLGQELCFASVSTKPSPATPIADNARAANRAGFADGLRACGCTEQTVKIRLAELENKP